MGLNISPVVTLPILLQVSEADADSNNSAAGIMDLANLGIRKRVVQLNVDDKKVSVGSEATGKVQIFLWPCWSFLTKFNEL